MVKAFLFCYTEGNCFTEVKDKVIAKGTSQNMEGI